MKLQLALVAAAFAVAAVSSADTTPVIFARAFAPAEGMVAVPEKPLRQELCLNGRWQFQPVAVPASFVRNSGTPPELPPPAPDKWDTTPIKIPSPWNANTWGNGRDAGEGTARPYVADSLYYPSYPAVWDGVEMGWLRRAFRVPADWANAGANVGARRFVLHFEAVAGEAQVFVNGKAAGSHFDSFLPFDCDVTDVLRPGDNELLVGVRKSSLFDKVSANYPENQRRTYPNGSNMDNLVGIWNDVSLLALPAVRVEDAFVKPLVDRDTLEVEITLRNDSAQPQQITIGGEVSPWVNLAGSDVLSAPEPQGRLDTPVLSLTRGGAAIAPGATATLTLRASVGNRNRLKLWSPETPNLYGLVLSVSGPDGAALDRRYVRFGWRQFKIQGRDLLLNGSKIQLVGDICHPFGPFIGSRRYAWAFYKMIKDVGGNAVRLHAQVHPRHYLDLADEMGLCVLEEAAIFGSSINLNLKEPVTWQRLGSHVDGMVLRDRSHPSVMGWGPGNEMFALFFKTSKEDRDAQWARFKEFTQRPRRLDPTRDWISVDGDADLDGTLPVWSKHMGIGLPRDLPDLDKPLMIGEHGGTYYAGPPLLKDINGDRAFESYAGRNEALAIDLYRMVSQVARPRLTYFSPSELVWFGLEHLPFGYRDATRPPGKGDGVFFPGYVEGQAGVQIERLPPYVCTLNPGFDPQLPLYKPLAMFDAMKAALDPRGPQPSPWDKVPAPVTRSHPAPSNAIAQVGFVGDRTGPLYQSLYLMGVPLADENATSSAALMVIDGERLSEADAARAQALAFAVLGRGGMVWVMLRDKGAALPQLKNLLADEVSVTARRATSLLRGAAHPAIDGFDLGQLYFVNEAGDKTIQEAGLGGAMARSGRVLLTAPDTDWSLFERQGENVKCSSVLIYEHLQKPAGAALVEVARGTGKLWVSSLDYQPGTPAFRTFWRQLFQNVGVKLGKPPVTALVPSGKDDEGALWRYTTEAPGTDWLQPTFDDAAWKTGRAGFGGPVPNGTPRTEWRTGDIWLRHAFTLQSLPQTLTLQVHHDEEVEIYLNGTQIFAERGHLSDYKEVPLGDAALKALRIGRNVLAVHCHQTAGGQFIDVGLVVGAVVGAPKRKHDLLLEGPVN